MLIPFVLSYIFIGLIDFFVCKREGRYYYLHTLINAYIMYLTLNDTYNIIFNTIPTLMESYVDNTPLLIILSLHIYHITPYMKFKLNYYDYIHHISSAFLGGLLLFFADYGPLQNYNFMFVCGLPGFLDYILLIGVKEKLIESSTEKKYNSKINLWIRSPFLIGTVIFSWIQINLQTNIKNYILVIRLLCMFIQYWNSQYFLEKIIIIHIRLQIKKKCINDKNIE